jgi:hypothetical protein
MNGLDQNKEKYIKFIKNKLFIYSLILVIIWEKSA